MPHAKAAPPEQGREPPTSRLHPCSRQFSILSFQFPVYNPPHPPATPHHPTRMKTSTFRSTSLFILLIITVPAALVYLAAKIHADRQLQQHEERISQEGKDAIAHVVKVNELRLTMPGKTPQEIAALVFPPLPTGFTLRPVTTTEREPGILESLCADIDQQHPRFRVLRLQRGRHMQGMEC